MGVEFVQSGGQSYILHRDMEEVVLYWVIQTQYGKNNQDGVRSKKITTFGLGRDKLIIFNFIPLHRTCTRGVGLLANILID